MEKSESVLSLILGGKVTPTLSNTFFFEHPAMTLSRAETQVQGQAARAGQRLAAGGASAGTGRRTGPWMGPIDSEGGEETEGEGTEQGSDPSTPHCSCYSLLYRSDLLSCC